MKISTGAILDGLGELLKLLPPGRAATILNLAQPLITAAYKQFFEKHPDQPHMTDAEMADQAIATFDAAITKADELIALGGKP